MDMREVLRQIQAEHAAVPAEEWEAQRRRFIRIGEAALGSAQAAQDDEWIENQEGTWTRRRRDWGDVQPL